MAERSSARHHVIVKTRDSTRQTVGMSGTRKAWVVENALSDGVALEGEDGGGGGEDADRPRAVIGAVIGAADLIGSEVVLCLRRALCAV